MSYAADGGTGRDETMLTFPLTLGSIRKLRFDIWPIAVATASMSALTKLSITGSSAARTPKATSARRRRPRLAAGIAPCAARRIERHAAPLEHEALELAAPAHHDVVRMDLAHHQLADRVSDGGRVWPAVFAEQRLGGRDQADEAHRPGRSGLRRRGGAEEAPRRGRGRLERARLLAERRRGLRARREQHPRAVSGCSRERCDQREIERQSGGTCVQPALQGVLETACHLQGIVSRSPCHYNYL